MQLLKIHNVRNIITINLSFSDSKSSFIYLSEYIVLIGTQQVFEFWFLYSTEQTMIFF